MGVPGLYYALIKAGLLSKENGGIVNINEDRDFLLNVQRILGGNVQVLCIDVPGLMHKAAEHTFAYGSYQNLVPTTTPTTSNAASRIAIKMLEYIKAYVARYYPEFLYVAIDGVVNMAKMEQQRKRRYVQGSKDLAATNQFDSNCLTPGTPMMNEIGSFLTVYMNREYKEGRLPQFRIDPATAAGEGEHKMIDYLRFNPGRSVLISDDADVGLIALSLDKPCLLKREVNSYHINVTALKYVLEQEYHIDVFNFICCVSMIGNDFVPHHDACLIDGRKTQSFTGKDVIIDALLEVLPDKPSMYPMTLDSIETLRQVLEFINTHYSEWDLLMEYKNQIMERNRKLYNETDPAKFSDMWYYYEYDYLGETRPDPAKIDQVRGDMCLSFICGLLWTGCYYIGVPFSTIWSYGFRAPPLWVHLEEYCNMLIDYAPQPDLEVLSSITESSDMYCPSVVHRVLVTPVTSWAHEIYGTLSPEEFNWIMPELLKYPDDANYYFPDEYLVSVRDVASQEHNTKIYANGMRGGYYMLPSAGYAIGGEKVIIPNIPLEWVLEVLDLYLEKSKKKKNRLPVTNAIYRWSSALMMQSFSVYYRDCPKVREVTYGGRSSVVSTTIIPNTQQPTNREVDRPIEQFPEVKPEVVPAVEEEKVREKSKESGVKDYTVGEMLGNIIAMSVDKNEMFKVGGRMSIMKS